MSVSKSIDILAPQAAARYRAEPTSMVIPYRKRVPRYAKLILALVLALNAFLLLLQGLMVAVAIFTTSIPAGLALFLTGIGLVVLAPAAMSLVAIRRVRQIKLARSRSEFWLKPATYFIGGLVVPWLALVVITFALQMLLRFLGLHLR